MVGTTGSVLIREVSFIQRVSFIGRFHCMDEEKLKYVLMGRNGS